MSDQSNDRPVPAENQAFAEGAPAAPEGVVGATQPEKGGVRPLWEGWHAPATPAEALKMGEEYARMEGLWCSGALFELRDDPDRSLGIVDEGCECEDCTKARAVKEKLETTGLGCGDIKACSVGILIMSVLDGPAVNGYMHYNYVDTSKSNFCSPEDELINHPVGQSATFFLGAGLRKAASERARSGQRWQYEDEDLVTDIERFVAGPTDKRFSVNNWRRTRAERSREQVISINDSDLDSFEFTQGERFHDMITRGFAYAREFAEKYQEQLGFGSPESSDPPALES